MSFVSFARTATSITIYGAVAAIYSRSIPIFYPQCFCATHPVRAAAFRFGK
jgi:hypothetical protein